MSDDRFEMVVKAVSTAGPGSWTAVISSPEIDTDNEVLESYCFEPLADKVPVHNGHGGPLIGSGKPYYVKGVLHLEGTYARHAEAQAVRQLVTDGHLHQMSIIPWYKTHKYVNGRKHITKGELLAADFVSIGANRQARVLAARSFDTSRKADPLELARARARAQLVLAQAELTLSEPEPLGDHATYIALHGAKAYTAAILRGCR